MKEGDDGVGKPGEAVLSSDEEVETPRYQEEGTQRAKGCEGGGVLAVCLLAWFLACLLACLLAYFLVLACLLPSICMNAFMC